jgi:transposase
MLCKDYNTDILGLEDVILKRVEKFENKMYIYITMKRRKHRCPNCTRETDKIHDYRRQLVKDLSCSGYIVYLVYSRRRYACPACGKRFREDVPFLPKYHRSTNRLIAKIISDFRGMASIKDISRQNNVSPATAIRYFSMVDYKCKSLPEVLSIDEFKGNAGGQRFQAIITDAKYHKVLDILPNRSSNTLSAYFRTFSTRKSVKYFVMDMNKAYLELARTCFPQATVVIDKYHVVRQAIWAFENVRKAEQSKFSDGRRRYFKRSRKLLLKHPDTLTDDERDQVSIMLLTSDRLQKAYNLKNKFQEFMRSKDKAAATEALKRWILLAEFCDLPEFRPCLRAVHNWDKYILNAFDCSYTNGYTEGCNNKIKVLKRISYGVRNFSRFRNRILHIMNSPA